MDATRYTRTTVLLLGALGLLTACGGDQGAPVADAGTDTDFVPDAARQTTYSVTEVTIPMRDGITLKANEYVPDASGPVPTVVYFYPYGRNLNLAGGTDGYFASNGYAELVVDVRGTGASGGTWELFAEAEQADYAEVIRWVTSRPHSDGQVVLGGQSYAAIASLLAMQKSDLDAIKAAFVRVPSADLYRDLATLGGAPNTGFLSWWSTAFTGLPASIQPLLNEDGPDVPTTAEHLSNFLRVLMPTYVSVLAGEFDRTLPPQLTGGQEGAYDSSWYHLRSPLREIEKIDVPTFVIGTNYDIFQRAQPMLFDALNLPTTQKKLLMVPDYHIFQEDWLSSDNGTREVRDDRGNVIPSENNLRLAWYDRWTKGVLNGISQFPAVTQYFHGKERAASYSEGLPEVAPKRFYLNTDATLPIPGSAGAGTLGNDSPSTPGQFSMLFQPTASTCSRMPVQYLAGVAPDNACSTDNRANEADAYNFTSAPAETDMRIYGPGNLKLWVSSTAPEAQVVAFLSDVAPDGSSTQVSFGQLMLSHRELIATPCETPVVIDCSVYREGELIQPWHPYTQDSQASLSPGQIYEINIEMNPTFLELKEGHRLRLSIKTGNAPASLPSASSLLSAVGGITTVHTGPDAPSRLLLGITPSQ